MLTYKITNSSHKDTQLLGVFKAHFIGVLNLTLAVQSSFNKA